MVGPGKTASALRLKMIEDMQLRDFAQRTQEAYVRAVYALTAYYRRSPDLLSEEEIRGYFLHLIKETELSRSTIRQQLSGIKFFYSTTLGREWKVFEMITPHRGRVLPEVLSCAEVHRLLGAVSPQHPVPAPTADGSGADRRGGADRGGRARTAAPAGLRAVRGAVSAPRPVLAARRAHARRGPCTATTPFMITRLHQPHAHRSAVPDPARNGDAPARPYRGLRHRFAPRSNSNRRNQPPVYSPSTTHASCQAPRHGVVYRRGACHRMA